MQPDEHDPDRIRAELRAARTEAEWKHADALARGLDRSFGDTDGKRIVKEAISEWLDKQFASFGKWSLFGIGAAALGALAYFILTSQGWRK